MRNNKIEVAKIKEALEELEGMRLLVESLTGPTPNVWGEALYEESDDKVRDILEGLMEERW